MAERLPIYIEIVCFTGNSGLTDYSVSLCKALQKIALVRLITSNTIPNRFKQLGFPVLLSFRRTRFYLIDLPCYVWKTLQRRPTTVIFQGPLKWAFLEYLAVLILRRRGIQMVMTIHDVLPHYPSFWSRLEFQLYYRCFDKLIVHSEAARRQIQNMNVQRPILVVPHGSYDLFQIQRPGKLEARRHLTERLTESDFVVLFFGALEPRKGIRQFIELAEDFCTYSGVKFVIAGPLEEKRLTGKDSEAFAKARMMKNIIVRDSHIPFEEVEHFFSASDVVALPYLEGSTSGVLKLAIAFGVPVIATPVGDIPEQVPPEAGIIIPLGHNFRIELTKALDHMKDNHQLFRAAMGKVAQNFNWPDIARKYYSFLLDGNEESKLTKI